MVQEDIDMQVKGWSRSVLDPTLDMGIGTACTTRRSGALMMNRYPAVCSIYY